ncbi:MAG: hypothetical protein QG671_1299, partial [Actinomycetota bacterium]|nr:hypothetical protein [Actinomycetota bacterium]
MRVAAAAGTGDTGPHLGPVSPKDLFRMGEIRVRIGHASYRRADPGGVRLLWSVPLTLRSREKHPLYLAAAVPDGCVRASSQVVWRAAVRMAPGLANLRADALRTALAIADALCDHADWDTMLSRPTHAELARAASCSTRTVARYRAVFERAGLVGIVTPGRTSDSVDPDGGRLAQAYVLTLPVALRDQLYPASTGRVPDVAGDASSVDPSPASIRPGTPVDEHVSPSCPTEGGSGEETPTRTRTSERARCARGGQPENRPDPGGFERGRGSFWPTTAPAATREQRRLAAAEAWRIDPVLRRVSVAHVAALFREWHLAGWTIADLRTALTHRPDDHPEGRDWPHSLVTADVRHVPGWVRHRLAAWRTDPHDPASPPAASPSQRCAAAR